MSNINNEALRSIVSKSQVNTKGNSPDPITVKLIKDQLGVVGNRGKAAFVKADVSRLRKEDVNLTDPKSMGLSNPSGETADGTDVIDPPYDLLTLTQIRESNNAITPMIDSYKTNISGFGYKIKYNIDMTSSDIEEAIKLQAKEEWITLDNFYKYCNFDQSFCSMLERVIDDKEYVGFGVLEILQNGKGETAGLEYIPAHTLKMTKLDLDPQLVEIEAVGPTGKAIKIPFQKRFRKFKQEVENEVVWFKEFGDPRVMDSRTGEFLEEGSEIEGGFEASGLIMFSNHVPYTVYGLPRWIGNIMSMQGSRRSEELNYRYFEKGRHIPMAILVNNGSLTESSIEVMQDYLNNVEGVDNAFGWLVLEAIGYENEDDGTVSDKAEIQIEPLLDAIQTDALFQTYDSNNRDKLRETLRLAPIYSGASKDYTRATADVARAITEEQVFQPERKKIEDKLNRLINHSLGIKYVEMALNGPDITNKKDLADAVAVYTRTGAVTPNMVVSSLSDLLGYEIEEIQAPWGSLPMTVVLELVKQGGLNLDQLMEGIDVPTGSPSFTDEGAGASTEED